MKTLRLILGDQLNSNHRWFKSKNKGVTYLMMEVRQETDYVKHHIQKVTGIFLSMRIFADKLVEEGHQVKYLKINDQDNLQSISENVNDLISKEGFDRFEYMEPDEYRLDRVMKTLCKNLKVETSISTTEHFLTERGDIAAFFQGKKSYLMESFYRHMRKKYDILMEGYQPLNGQWNFDASNRKSYPKQIVFPDRIRRKRSIRDLLKEIEQAGIQTIGSVNQDVFMWPTQRSEALDDLKAFCDHYLPNFGNYQDAMHTASSFGYHSLLSFALNVKLLHPTEVVQKVISTWESKKDEIDFAAVEGFVRQIIGWREYMRGIYWAKMPEYSLLNELNHQNELPAWFWTGNTKMNCLHHSIQQSLDKGYAHHIQRLMVTGNFGLLAGIHPDEMDQWYLGIYIDAFEWVEITNTRGMSQFADGGIVGTKPYVSSANYLHKMSNYCKSCFYDYKEKTGERACPFNSLYWHFHERHRPKLEKNPRIGMVYRTWDKMGHQKQKEILKKANEYLDKLNSI